MILSILNYATAEVLIVKLDAEVTACYGEIENFIKNKLGLNLDEVNYMTSMKPVDIRYREYKKKGNAIACVEEMGLYKIKHDHEI